MLRRKTTKYPPLVYLLCCISLISAYCGFHYTSKHVPAVLNGTADALSRYRVSRVASFALQIPQFHLLERLHRLLITERTWTELFTFSIVRIHQESVRVGTTPVPTVLHAFLPEPTSSYRDSLSVCCLPGLCRNILWVGKVIPLRYSAFAHYEDSSTLHLPRLEYALKGFRRVGK